LPMSVPVLSTVETKEPSRLHRPEAVLLLS
jgi:hypothetical protein